MFGVKNGSKIIRMKRPETKIGRNRTNNVILAKSLKISRFHAVIKFFEDIPFIKDVSVSIADELSEWGVYLNKLILPKNRWVEVAVGDAIAFGAASVEDGGLIIEVVDLEPEPEEDTTDLDNMCTQKPVPLGSSSNREMQTIDMTLDDVCDREPRENRTSPGPSSTPAPKSSNGEGEATICIVSDDEEEEDDDEIIFISPTRAPPSHAETRRASVSHAETKPALMSPTRAPISHAEIAETKPAMMSSTPAFVRHTETKPQVTPPPAGPSTPLDVTATMNGLLRPSPVITPPPLPQDQTIPPPPDDDIENQLAQMIGQSLSPTVDVKPIIKQECHFRSSEDLCNVLNSYSHPDEIISLDSDEEDFPSSQLDCTQMAEVSDFSSAFEMMYELKSEVPFDDEEDVKFICQESWFGPLSQTNENIKSELTKAWRKNDADFVDFDEPSNKSNDVSSHDEVDNALSTPVAVTEPATSPASSAAPEVQSGALLKKKETERQVAIIAPLPQRRHKRRSADTDDHRSKKLKEDKFKSPTKKHKSRSHSSSSSSAKKEMREKVKALYPEPPPEAEKQPKEIKAQPKVKITSKNRGDFLTKLDTASSISASASTSASSSPKPVPKTKPEPEPLKITKSKSGSSSVTKDHSKDIIHKLKIPRIAVPNVTVANDLIKAPPVSPPVNDEIHVTSSKTPVPRLPISISRPATKSILKVKLTDVSKLTYDTNSRSGPKKAVKFPERIISGCKEIEVEYKTNEISSFKTYEKFITRCNLEFEQALGVILKWNVTWLQEQQKHPEPPPVYSSANFKIVDFVDKYKEELKESMFRGIWKNIFNTWNVPNNDNFPQTQDPGSGQISNFYTIEIEKVEGSQRDSLNPLMTIHARREVLFFEAPDRTIGPGKITILNFRYTKPPLETAQKTRVFAYIHSYTRCTEGTRTFDRITLRISAKPFQIVCGEAKMKVLNYYARGNLKQFQALGWTKSCPVIQPLCDVTFHDCLNSMNNEDRPKLSTKLIRLLDSAQKKAVLTSLNCLTKDSSVSLINGSSGTGKTQVIVSLIHELCHSNDPGRILIVTINDKLADDLVYRMCKDEFPKNVLRFGSCGNINQNVKHCAFDYKMQALIQKEGKDLVDVEDEIKIVNSQLMKLRNEIQCRANIKNKDALELKMKECDREIRELRTENSRMVTHLREQVARLKVAESSDIVIAPYTTCWSSNFENSFVPNNTNKADFTPIKICIFDDANFLDENSMLIPQMLQVKHLILVGDKKAIAFQNSPYNKLLHFFNTNNKDFVTSLDVDYRACPEVSEFVREYFKLNGDVKVPSRKRKLNVKPFLVIDQASSQLVNQQAILCDKLAKCILEMDVGRSSIGVLVSQNSDKDHLRSQFTTSNVHNKILIDVFDEFSTREMDITIVCLPRSKISDQWLYIALTRAKSALIICGDFDAIEPVPPIASLLDFSKRKNLFFSLRGDNMEQISPEKLKAILSC